MPLAGTVIPSSDFGMKRLASASSNSFTRNTPFEPAPVTATRISEPRLDSEHPDQRKAGRRMFELLVGGLLGDREADLGDDLVRLERGREHALEIIVGLDLRFEGDDGRAQAEHRRRIIGVGIIVGE